MTSRVRAGFLDVFMCPSIGSVEPEAITDDRNSRKVLAIKQEL